MDQVKIQRVKCLNNNATISGGCGSVWVLGNRKRTATVQISDVLVENNRADESYGGISIQAYDTMAVWLDVSVVRTLFRNNSATVATGGLDIYGGCQIKIRNAIFLGNR